MKNPKMAQGKKKTAIKHSKKNFLQLKRRGGLQKNFPTGSLDSFLKLRFLENRHKIPCIEI